LKRRKVAVPVPEIDEDDITAFGVVQEEIPMEFGLPMEFGGGARKR